MDCSDVDHALIDTGTQLPPHAEGHVSTCPRCQDLLRALNSSDLADPPSAATLREIERRIAVDLRPVKPVQLARLVAAFGVIFICAVLASALYPGARGFAAMSLVQAAVMFGVLAVGALLLADSVVRQMIPASRHRIPPKLLPVLVILALVLVAAVMFPFQREQSFWAEWWYCFRAGGPVALLALAPFWLVLRRGATLSPLATGASTGLLAGLVGSTILEVRCSNLDAWHILLSHFGVAATGALLGLLAGYYYQTRHPGLAA